MRGAALLITVAVAFVTVACGDDTPTSPSSSTPTTSTVTFAGTLGVGDARFYSFTNAAAGSVSALLASIETKVQAFTANAPALDDVTMLAVTRRAGA